MIACFWFRDLPIRSELKRHPHLAGEPFAVAASDGIVHSLSHEAGLLGVRAGQTATSARALCRGLIVLPYDHAEYDQAAESLWDALAIESSILEPVSPEICYLQISGPDMLSRVTGIASTIAEASYMPVYVGLGLTKLVAHRAALASSQENFVTYVPLGNEPIFLADTRLSSGVLGDPKLVAQLARLGVETFADLRRIPRAELDRKFKRISYKLSRLVVGIDDDPVKPKWPPPIVDCTFFFEEEIELNAPIHAALNQCALKIATDLVSTSRYCRSLTLTVQLDDHSFLRERESLAIPLRDGASLLKAALRLLMRIRPERPLLDVCLVAGDLDIGSGVQLALLDDNESARNYPHERKRNLEAVLRYLRRKHGYSIVMPAALLAQARRFGFWTHYLAKLRDEQITVATNAKGEPVRYARNAKRRKGITYTVHRVIDRWRETSWKWGKVIESQAYRVITMPNGTYELCKLDEGDWRLRSVDD